MTGATQAAQITQAQTKIRPKSNGFYVVNLNSRNHTTLCLAEPAQWLPIQGNQPHPFPCRIVAAGRGRTTLPIEYLQLCTPDLLRIVVRGTMQ
jgi:hypothetical protein